MSDTGKNPTLPCPFCEGRGHMPKSELFDRLHGKDLAKKIETYLACIVEADEKTAAPSQTSGIDDHVQAWNCTHFLWRRSAKE